MNSTLLLIIIPYGFDSNNDKIYNLELNISTIYILSIFF